MEGSEKCWGEKVGGMLRLDAASPARWVRGLEVGWGDLPKLQRLVCGRKINRGLLLSPSLN